MKTRKWRYLRAVTVVSMLMLANANALTLSKDTVYESKFAPTTRVWAIWNDSVSLINKTSDTVRLEAIHFVVPPGKYADIKLGYDEPYRKDGPPSGLEIGSGQRYVAFSDRERTFPPKGRVLITGFWVESCIMCPVGQGSSGGDKMDTLVMYLIFDTRVARDTLIVIGDVRTSSSSVNLFPRGPQPTDRGGTGYPFLRYFNILGQFLPQKEQYFH